MDVKLLRSFWIKGIEKHPGRNGYDFTAWINRGTYRIIDIQKAGQVSVNVVDTGPFLESFAYDIARFACASIESFEGLSVVSKFPKATAWTAVRSYYAAYYAAHAIIRLFGYIFSQLEDGHIQILQDYASLYGVTTLLKRSGNYSGRFDARTNDLTLIHKNDSHRDLWKTFVELLGRLSVDVLKINDLPNKKQNISASLNSLKDALEGQGAYVGGGWLSHYRNNINYRHEYGAWFPYSGSSIRFSDIQKYLQPWKEDVSNFDGWLLEKNERIRFFGVCASVTLLCRRLTEDLESVYSTRNNVHNQMAIAFRKRAVVNVIA